ncbi:hypothetical protein GFY24_04455 [Nocardia sp. SYP-A9097]|uniref:hypothetical protein n=1 Tax=Nocardia sp. SYP-A9097 TaxID=2663237 RepID=UPI00129A6C8C|nr:hypothetical protein [Nocardia sp. SYP-A9097]MRH86727.1 hypothetical protein [Nocardia sp. SYP-A9097]
MSANCDLYATVKGLADLDEAQSVKTAVEQLLREEFQGGWDFSVEVKQQSEAEVYVTIESLDTVIIGGNGSWTDVFDDLLAERVSAVVPNAKTDTSWSWPDYR